MAPDSKSIKTALLVVIGLILAIIMAVSVSTNAAGGLAALIPLIAAILALLAITKPKAGIYGLAALVIWVDEFKRLAVYFGGANSITVIQTLAMPFVVLAALNAGFLINLMFGKVRVDRIGILIYAAGLLIGVAIFLAFKEGFADRAQRAANLAGYITVIPIACAYFKSFEDWRKFFAFQVIVALPSVAWAIKQYYYGFDQIEWEYARSGLSRVHYAQMFGFLEPRVFGFFGSASGLACASIYCSFAWWHSFRYRERRWLLWLPTALILSWGLVASTQRAALLFPFITFGCAFLFRTRWRTAAFYFSVVVMLVVAVGSAEYLLNDGLEEINRAITVQGGWGEKVLNVGTFSDRLRGWERLSRWDTWSLLGTGNAAASSVASVDVNSADYNHDVVNKVLINYGVVGLLCILIPGAAVLRVLHGAAYNQENRDMRNDAAFALALSLPMIMISFMGGDNFNTNPMNLQIWTSFVGVLVCRETTRGAAKAKIPEPADPPASAAMLSPVARKS